MGMSLRSASRKLLNRAGITPDKARSVAAQVRETASAVGETTGQFLESATKVIATAAGAAVGAVQAATAQDNAPADDNASAPGSATAQGNTPSSAPRDNGSSNPDEPSAG
jgi:hypothetical protein